MSFQIFAKTCLNIKGLQKTCCKDMFEYKGASKDMFENICKDMFEYKELQKTCRKDMFEYKGASKDMFENIWKDIFKGTECPFSNRPQNLRARTRVLSDLQKTC